LSSAFINGGENPGWGLSGLGQNRPSPIQSGPPAASSDIQLETHIKEARRAIGKLVEREHRARQYDAHQKALAWLAENRGRYLDQWVALQGDELLATGSAARDVYARVRGLEPVPLVVKIESEQLPFGGW
jgi:hypothetical protein